MSNRRTRFEALEARNMLALLPGLDWNGLSVSFAPDQVDIAGEPNQLEQTMTAAFPDQDWQGAILSGFQRWTAEINQDIVVVDEIGLNAFGAEGKRTGDERFGDVRIGARPLSSNAKAITVPTDSLLTGTWSGDIIFNSSASFESLESLLAVALHESGHAFGLSNSDDPDSAMNSHTANAITRPSTDDVRAIQDLHGERLPDNQELRNDSLELATPIDSIAVGIPGAFPYLLQGDIQNNDVDYYTIDTTERTPSEQWPFLDIDECCQDLKVRLRSEGLSLLSPELSILDSDGNVVAHSASTSTRGDVLEVEVSTEETGDLAFLRIASPRSDDFGHGSYIAEVQLSNDGSTFERKFSDRITRILRDRYYPARTHSSIFSPGSFVNGVARKRWDIGDSVRTSAFYVPTDMQNATVVQASVLPVDPNGIVPKVEFANSKREVVQSTVLVNDRSEQIIQAPISSLDPWSFLFVTPIDDDATGDYLITIRFLSDEFTLDEFVQDQVTAAAPHNSHPFQVTVSEFNHFSFEAKDSTGGGLALIRNSQGDVVRSIQSGAGETKTASGVFLPPGDYQVDVLAAPNTKQDLSYALTRTVLSDPFGVTLVEPNELDFSCPNVAGAFCYPGGIQSEQPDLWGDFLDDQPEKPTIPAEDQPEAFLGPWWDWYWNTTQPNSNSPPLAIADQYQSNASHMLAVDASLGILANDVDPNDDDVEVSILRKPSSGQLELHQDGSFIYRPFPGFVGEDSFDYQIFDGEHQSRIATVTVDVATPVKTGDFDADGRVSANDINIVAAAAADGTDTRFDLDQSGNVDESDLTYMVRTIVGVQLGDTNLDGSVDAIDLNIVGKHWQQSVTNWSQGDLNGDGIVDALDLHKIALSWTQHDTHPNARPPRAPLSNLTATRSPAARDQRLLARRVAADSVRSSQEPAPQANHVPVDNALADNVVDNALADHVLRSWRHQISE